MKISVVIPLYNKSKSILNTIKTVLDQSCLPNEIVIVNDGSTDGSEEIVEKMNHPLIVLIHQKNAGVSAARNKGIETAKNEWIAFLDADDVWNPEYIKEIKSLAKSYPDCNVFATAYILQDYLGNNKSIVLNKIPFKETTGKLTNYFEVASCSHPPLWSSAIVVKRTALLAIKGFPSCISSGEDLLTWAALAKQYHIAYSKTPLAIYNMPNLVVDRKRRFKSIQINDEIVTNNFKQLLNLRNKYERQYFAEWLKIISRQYLDLGLRTQAIKSILYSIRYRPLKLKLYLYIFILLLPAGLSGKIIAKFS